MTKRLKKNIYIFCGVITTYAIIGFLIIPLVLKAKLPEIIKEKTGKTATVTDIKFNPFALTLSMQGFEMKEPEGEKLIGLGEFFFNFGLFSSISHLAAGIDEIRLTELYINAKIRKNGDINLADLSQPSKEPEPEPPEEEGDLFPVWIRDIKIERGHVLFSDNSLPTPFKKNIQPLNFTVKNLTTKKSKDDSKINIAIELENGGKLDWTGDLTINPVIKSEGSLTLNSLNMHTLWEYIQDQFNFKIQKGALAIYSDYSFELIDDKPQLLLANGKINLTEFDLTAKENSESVINIPSFSINKISLDLLKQQVNIQEIASNESRFLTNIDPKGELNFIPLFASNSNNSAKEEPKPAEKAEKKPPGKPWVVDIANIKLTNYSVDFTLETEGNPVKIDLKPISLSIDNFKTVPGNQFNLDLNIGVNKSGRITSKGKVGIDPVITSLNIKADKLGLKPFQPFLDQSTKLQIVSGSLDLDNKFNFSQDKDGKNELKLTGNASINGFKTVEANTNKEFLGWQAITLNDLKFSLEPMSLDIAVINIDKILSKVVINKDKSTNISKIFSSPNPKAKPEKKEPPKNKEKENKDSSFALNIGTIKFKEGESYFADRSLIIPFAANIKRLNGSVTRISTDTKNRSSINLNGKVNQVSPVSIKGSLSPFDFQNHLDMRISFKGLDMTTATPYMAEFAGYKIEKGKLTLALDYKIKRKKLNATNQVVINQLTLGEEIESPNSVDLPLKLGLGLLKDSKGVIDLNLPIEGSLDDPEFSVFGLIGKVLLNLITKAVTAPFSMMADLLGTNADLSQIAFAKGSSEISKEQKKVLSTVAEGLKKRPQLQLEVKGKAYQEEDTLGLAERKLDRKIKKVLWEDLDEDERPATVDKIKLVGEDYLDLLTDEYEEKFPDTSDELVDKAEDAETPEQAKLYYDQMKKQIVASITIKEESLEKLANQRATNISDFLTQQTIDVERIFVLGEEIQPKTEDGNISTHLNLTAQ